MTDCRFCQAPLSIEAYNGGDQPLANRLLPLNAPALSDPRFPLRVMVCQSCLLVQLQETVDPTAMFGDYNYLSSVSSSWLRHAERFAAAAIDRFALGAGSLVVEAGSNDGYLLREFLRRGIPCLGVDPAANIGAQARRDGIPTVTAFFGEQTAAALAAEGKRADLLVANNVLAHVPGLMGFLRGSALLLAPGGVLSIEVPHVRAMLDGAQFDTIYHEHVFYFSAFTLRRILAGAGLCVFDIEILPTHGGSLRVLAQHRHTGSHPVAASVEAVLASERQAGLHRPETYVTLAGAASRVVTGLRRFLSGAAGQSRSVGAYGAAAKGVMLLNAAAVTPEDIRFVADANPLKQNHLIPGCRIPVVPRAHLRAARPDYLVILPWNIASEIMTETEFIAEWGGRFVIPSPALRVLSR